MPVFCYLAPKSFERHWRLPDQSVFLEWIAMDGWLFVLALVVTWVWVVGERGDWNLVTANLAGCFAGWVVGLVVKAVYEGFVGGTSMQSSPHVVRSLLMVLSSLGAFAGVWIWVVHRKRPTSKLTRHIIGAAFGIFAGFDTLMLLTRFIPLSA
ncbi:hypothetical protein [Pseudomonas moraviensis]|nr:hypothetical protein [Pseudomonas moraviensis]